MEYFYSTDFRDGYWYPDDAEAHHISHVLRRVEGDELTLVNGEGLLVKGNLEKLGRKVRIAERSREYHVNPETVCMAVCPVKSAERMEWMLEKLVEIGVKRIWFVDSDHSEKSRMQERRMQLKAVSAMKQSLKLHLPELRYGVKFSELLQVPASANRFLAHCYSDMGAKFAARDLLCSSPLPGEVWIAIGPEGDFSRREVEIAAESGFSMLDLGNARLRSETAALLACTLFRLNSVSETKP